ncbi:MAG: hypothetical protein WBG42_01095 [Cryomorphaceae bacterium]
MRVHIVNAIAWAGVIIALSNTIPTFTFQATSILIAGFMLEMMLLIVAFRELKARNKN